MDGITRRKARAIERERLRQREQQKNQLIKRIVIALAALALVVALVVLISSLVGAGADEREAAAVEDEETTSMNAEDNILQAFSQYYFYEEERGQRYLDFQAAHPDLSPEQVVVQVNVELDFPAYERTIPVADPGALLALVSKHHYLPFDYQPASLASYGDLLLCSEVIGPLEQLLADAVADGVYLNPASGFRDAATQEVLYNGYMASLGTEWAEAQSARAGFSEHQTGYVLDFGPANYEFYDTPEDYWLVENAYKYGFIVRFTEENSDVTLYIHEPWHIRYVGVDVANFMHENNIGSLEEYWVKYVQHSPQEAT